jgi:hypothetical protein
VEDDVHTLAAEQGLDLETLRAALTALRMHAGGDAFYVFWTPRAGAASEGMNKRVRLLLAFPSPDAALGFAQRNRLTQPPAVPRLRRLSLVQLLRAVLREPASPHCTWCLTPMISRRIRPGISPLVCT